MDIAILNTNCTRFIKFKKCLFTKINLYRRYLFIYLFFSFKCFTNFDRNRISKLSLTVFQQSTI